MGICKALSKIFLYLVKLINIQELKYSAFTILFLISTDLILTVKKLEAKEDEIPTYRIK